VRGRLQLRHLSAALCAQLALPVVALAQDEGAAAAEETRLRLFVSEFDLDEQAPIDAKTANGVLAARMGRLGQVFRLKTQEEVRQVLDHASLQQLLGSEQDPEALMRLGETIEADRILHGHIGKAGETYVATLTLFDLDSGVVEKRVAGTFKGAEDLAITRLNEQADQMLAYLLQTYAPDKLNQGRKVAVRLGKKKAKSGGGPSWIAAGGLGLAGLGAGIAAGGGVTHALMADDAPGWAPIAMYAGGGVALVTGLTLALIPWGGDAAE
jgi:hypothetical protein